MSNLEKLIDSMIEDVEADDRVTVPDATVLSMLDRLKVAAQQDGAREAVIEECAKVADRMSGKFYAARSQSSVPEQRAALTDKHTVAAQIAVEIRLLATPEQGRGSS